MVDKRIAWPDPPRGRCARPKRCGSGVAANEGSAVIIQEQGDHLILIRQTDHAVLSGYFARECGNESFARPEPFESFQLAATAHDNRWREWELHRRIAPVSFLPCSFMCLPDHDHLTLYRL